MSQLEFEFIRKARRKAMTRNFLAAFLALGTLLTFVYITYGYLSDNVQFHQRIDDLPDAERANR